MAITRRQFGQLIGLGAVGAAVAKAPSAFAQDGSTLRIAMNTSDIQTLDPHFASGTQDRATVDMLFNGLVRFVPGTSDEFEADLAEEVPEGEDNDDGTQTWTFTLKEGVMTHAGEGVESAELTVDDLVFSFEKAANPDSSAYAGDYEGWSFAAGEGDREFRSLWTFRYPLPCSCRRLPTTPVVTSFRRPHTRPWVLMASSLTRLVPVRSHSAHTTHRWMCSW